LIEIIKSATFDRWLDRLADARARARIQVRLDRLRLGNFGDAKAVGDGISELRVDYGPGYRVYFARRGARLVLLLCGGDKSTQSRDIAAAKTIASQWAG
jgi:putative addiction module killer protein